MKVFLAWESCETGDGDTKDKSAELSEQQLVVGTLFKAEKDVTDF